MNRTPDEVSPDPALRSCLDGVAEAEALLADVRRRLSRLCLGEEHLMAIPRGNSAPLREQSSGLSTPNRDRRSGTSTPAQMFEATQSLATDGSAESLEQHLAVKRLSSNPHRVNASTSSAVSKERTSEKVSRLTTSVIQAFNTAAQEEDQAKLVAYCADQVVIDPGQQHGLIHERARDRTSDTYASPDVTPPISSDFIYTQCYGCIWLPMVHPEANFRLIWLFIGFFFILYECYSLPFILAFNEQPEGFFFALASVINVYFLCDVPLSFTTGYMTNEGHIDMDPLSVASRYARSWLALDLIASIPWEWFTESKSWVNLTRSSKGFRLIRVSRALRLVRLVRVFKLKVMLDTLESFIEANQMLVFVVGIAKLSFAMSALTHWGACIWYAIGSQDTDGTTWVKYYLTEEGYNGPRQHYIWSLYFTLTTLTTVGYGDITPRNFGECLFTLVLLVNASVLFAGLLGVLTDLISSLNRHSRLRMERKNTLSRYMRWRKLPRKLKIRIRAYLLFLWDTKETHEAHEDDIMSELPPVLKSDLCYHIFGRPLSLAPFLSWLKDYPVCLKYLACNISCSFLDAGDYLFRIGDPSDQVHMILCGSVWLTRNEHLADDDWLFNKDDTKIAEQAKADFQKKANKKQDARSGTFVRHAMQLPRHNTTMLTQAKRNLKSPKFISRIVSSRQASRISSFEKFGSEPDEKQPDENMQRAVVATTSRSDFDSELLRNAYERVQSKDTVLDRAALKVQRKWRKRMELKKQHQMQRASFVAHGFKNYASTLTTIHQRIAHMPSRTVAAPAYFGESCLWRPAQEWEDSTSVPRTYLAKCLERSETLCIPRLAVKKVLDQFRPWLPERFENFRQAVIEGMEDMEMASLKAADVASKNKLRTASELFSCATSRGIVSNTLFDVVDAVSPRPSPRKSESVESKEESKEKAASLAVPGLIE